MGAAATTANMESCIAAGVDALRKASNAAAGTGGTSLRKRRSETTGYFDDAMDEFECSIRRSPSHAYGLCLRLWPKERRRAWLGQEEQQRDSTEGPSEGQDLLLWAHLYLHRALDEGSCAIVVRGPLLEMTPLPTDKAAAVNINTNTKDATGGDEAGVESSAVLEGTLMWAQRSQRRMSPLRRDDTVQSVQDAPLLPPPPSAGDMARIRSIDSMDGDDDDGGRNDDAAAEDEDCFAGVERFDPAASRRAAATASSARDGESSASPPASPPWASASLRAKGGGVVTFSPTMNAINSSSGFNRTRSKSVLLDTIVLSGNNRDNDDGGRSRVVTEYVDAVSVWPSGFPLTLSALATMLTVDVIELLNALELRLRIGRALARWASTAAVAANDVAAVVVALATAEEQGIMARAIAAQLLEAHHNLCDAADDSGASASFLPAHDTASPPSAPTSPWSNSSSGTSEQRARAKRLRFAVEESQRIVVDAELLLGRVSRVLYEAAKKRRQQSPRGTFTSDLHHVTPCFKLDADTLLRVCTHHAAAAKEVCEGGGFGWRHRCMIDILTYEADVLESCGRVDRAVLAQQRAIGVAIAVAGSQYEHLGELYNRLQQLQEQVGDHDVDNDDQDADKASQQKSGVERGRELSVIAL